MNKYKKKVEKYKKRFMFTQPIPPPLTMFHLIFNKTEESCGTFIPAYDDISSYIFNVHTIGELRMGGRKSCKFNNINNEPYIWHTHVVGSRFYPSFEDIRKVIIHSKIKKSLIFTPFGYWELSYNGPPKTRDEVNDPIKNNVDYANRDLNTVIYREIPSNLTSIKKLDDISDINNYIFEFFFDLSNGKPLYPVENGLLNNINIAITKYESNINKMFPAIQIKFNYYAHFYNLIIY